ARKSPLRCERTLGDYPKLRYGIGFRASLRTLAIPAAPAKQVCYGQTVSKVPTSKLAARILILTTFRTRVLWLGTETRLLFGSSKAYVLPYVNNVPCCVPLSVQTNRA